MYARIVIVYIKNKCKIFQVPIFKILPNFSVVNNEKYGIMNNSEREQAKPAHRERRIVYGIHQTKRM